MIDDGDHVGYGADPLDPHWSGGARIAVAPCVALSN
jgi:hypothetical protein